MKLFDFVGNKKKENFVNRKCGTHRLDLNEGSFFVVFIQYR